MRSYTITKIGAFNLGYRAGQQHFAGKLRRMLARAHIELGRGIKDETEAEAYHRAIMDLREKIEAILGEQ